MFARRTRERELHKKGFLHIVGIDEVGRGALAGPLVAAAVVFASDVHIPGVRDSKLLTSFERERLFPLLTKKALTWSVGVVSNNAIDVNGIQDANRTAFLRALDGLRLQPDFVFFDWLTVEWRGVVSEAVIAGDKKIFSIAAASIIAKVWRDRYMHAIGKQFPVYCFSRNKGYGTLLHRRRINTYGPSPIHRKSFLHAAPVLE